MAKNKSREVQKGIVMANGVVLKDGLNVFKADEKLVSDTLRFVAKISKGLYSGILNDDTDFIKVQQETIDNIIENATEKISEDVVKGAEKQLKRISTQMALSMEKEKSYLMHRHYGEATPIEMSSEEFKKTKNNSASILSNIGATSLEELKKINESIEKKRAKTTKDVAKARRVVKTKKEAKKKTTKKVPVSKRSKPKKRKRNDK